MKTAADFRAFSTDGRELAHWHLLYETVPLHPGAKLDTGKVPRTALTDADYRVTKMKFAKTRDPETQKSISDKTTVIYNERITIRDIPLAAYEYVVNGKPALEWVMERQAVTTDKDSGIVNDANLWATETMANAQYPLELFLRVITVSLETMKIVNALPGLELPKCPMNRIRILLPLFVAVATGAHGLTYDQWKSQVFTNPEAQDAGVSGELADPDKDGINNLLEYAMNGDPKTADKSLMPAGGKSSGALTLQFKRRREALDLDYVVEVSDDLVTWSGGFGNVWITDAVPTDLVTVTANQVPQVVADTVTATSQVPAGFGGTQFMRLKVIRSPRSGLKSTLQASGLEPLAMLTNSVVPTGLYAGAVTQYPVLVPNKVNYIVQWYFAAQAMAQLAETNPAKGKALVRAYLSNLDASDNPLKYRIHDVDLYSGEGGYPPWSLWGRIFSDSDDAYAGAILLLAGKLKRLHPTDDWLDHETLPSGASIRAMLKSVAYTNITTQAKNLTVREYAGGPDIANRSIRVYQGGNSNVSDPGFPKKINNVDVLQITGYGVGLFMDNVQVWAGLNEFTTALEMIEGAASSDVIYYKGWRNQQLETIHAVFWDSQRNAWRISDDAPGGILKGAESSPFYAALLCQLYPQLYGMPYPGNTAETQRRYNMAWKWVVDHMPNWPQSVAWPSGPDDDKFSHIEIAVIAAQMGETQKVADFLNMARARWLPGGSVTNGTVSEQIGFWHLLVGY